MLEYVTATAETRWKKWLSVAMGNFSDFFVGRPKSIVRVCWKCLAESPVKRSFNSHPQESFNRVWWEARDIESEWTMFRALIVEVADQCCGRKVVAIAKP